jgi:hypothetical protein
MVVQNRLAIRVFGDRGIAHFRSGRELRVYSKIILINETRADNLFESHINDAGTMNIIRFMEGSFLLLKY